jgi:NADP-dependent 3-hydroxy acid dehydrogenase YdfG
MSSLPRQVRAATTCDTAGLLKNKAIVITGAGGAIGHASATHLASLGTAPVINDVRKEALESGRC